MARRNNHAECVRILTEAPIRIPYDRVLVSLNCAVVLTQNISLVTTIQLSSSSLCQLFCDENYQHLLPLVMEMITG